MGPAREGSGAEALACKPQQPEPVALGRRGEGHACPLVRRASKHPEQRNSGRRRRNSGLLNVPGARNLVRGAIRNNFYSVTFPGDSPMSPGCLGSAIPQYPQLIPSNPPTRVYGQKPGGGRVSQTSRCSLKSFTYFFTVPFYLGLPAYWFFPVFFISSCAINLPSGVIFFLLEESR